MNCYLHPDRDANAFCRTCGRPLCAEDQREIYGVVYCQDCLARQLGHAAPAAAGFVPTAAPGAVPGAPLPGVPVPGAPNAGIALLLGFIPGVGAIYNSQYFKAFVQVVVFAFLIAMANSSNSDAAGTFFGLGIAGFYFYMLIDSYHTAKQMQLGQPVHDIFSINPSQTARLPIAAIVLILIGVIFLLRSLGFFEYDASRYLGPLVLIAIGAWLLLRHRGTPSA
ncbi:MAG: B-box zinc finger protein [Terriglobales bacterium]